MHTPYLPPDTLSTLHPIEAKVLILLCDSEKWGSIIAGTATDFARRAALSRRRWSQAMATLAERGLIQLENRPGGFHARVRPTKRFTWVPSFRDGRLWRASPRALKVLLALARHAGNATGTLRVRLAKVAALLGRGVRSVQLGLNELRRRSCVETYRTGRANWFLIRRPGPDGADDRAPDIAPRARLLVRLLSSTPLSHLSQIIQRASEKREQAVRRLLNPLSNRTHQTGLLRLLVRSGVGRREAAHMAELYTPREILNGLDLLIGRRVRDVGAFLRRALSVGWCA